MIQKDTSTPVFTAAKTGATERPSTGEWIKETQHIQHEGWDSAIKKRAMTQFTATMDGPREHPTE